MCSIGGKGSGSCFGFLVSSMNKIKKAKAKAKNIQFCFDFSIPFLLVLIKILVICILYVIIKVVNVVGCAKVLCKN